MLAMFNNPVFGQLLRHWRYAVTSMQFVNVKLLSHKGCILDWRRKRNNGYPWIDPGNFVYSVFWKLLGFAARFVLGRRQERAEAHGAAFAVEDVQGRVKERWARAANSARLAELHGDILEMSLALGYLSNDDMPLVRMLSEPICQVRDIVSYVETHGPFDRTGDTRARSPLSSPKAQHVTALANTIWCAMQVQHYGISNSHDQYRSYLEFAQRVNLMYR